MREELQEIKRYIYEDGHISDSEVKLLRDVFSRYGVGEDEARLLLDLNSVLSGEDHVPAFDDLFVETIVAYLIENAAVSEQKWAWLEEQVFSDSDVNASERKILATLAERGIGLPASLMAHL